MLGPASPAAMWRSITDRAKYAAKTSPGTTASELQREYVYQRLLARVFYDQRQPWVLKGGTALLMRVDDARHSKDVDLLHKAHDLDTALDDLQRTLDQDLGDWMHFSVKSAIPLGANQQPGVEGQQINIHVYCGTNNILQFHIDLVVGSRMTADPDIKTASTVIAVPGIPAPYVRLYPIVDHIADKVCATESSYPNGLSSRGRDLVDIIIMARTQSINGTALRTAIDQERVIRKLPLRQKFVIPGAWATSYSKEAENTSCPASFNEAVQLAQRFIEPVLRADSDERDWLPQHETWA